MARPLPPQLHGPLYAGSAALRITGVLDGAEITIFVDGESSWKGPRPVDGWVSIDTSLGPDQAVTAIQTFGGDASAPSIDAVIVIPAPAVPSAPVFASVVNTQSALVAMDHLTVGATLEIARRNDEVIVATVLVERPFLYVKLDTNLPISDARALMARQRLGSNITSWIQSPLLVDVEGMFKERKLPAPHATEPLTACRSDITLQNCVPGLEVAVRNEGLVTTWLAGVPTWTVTDCQMLKQGKLDITQGTARQPDVEGISETLEIRPPTAPEAPTIVAPFCDKIAKLAVTGLNPGSIAYVWGQRGSASNEGFELVGFCRVDTVEQALPVPADYLLDPRPTQYRVSQERCGIAGPNSSAVGLGGSAPDGPPRFDAPLIACSDFVLIGGVALGGEIRLYDDNKYPISDPVIIFSDPQRVATRPLVKGENIVGSVRYCDKTVEVPRQTVVADTSGARLYLQPVKPDNYELKFHDAAVGTRIEITRRAPGRAEVRATELWVDRKDPVVQISPPAVLDEVWNFIVTICGNAIDKGSVTTQRGSMKTKVTSSLTAGQRGTLRVDASDSQTGEGVTTFVYISNLPGVDPNASVAVGGSVFPLDVPTGRVEPINGKVTNPGYLDATYSAPVTQPPATVATVRAHLEQTNGGAVITQIGDFNLTVTGANFPVPTNGIKLEILYRDINGVDPGGNPIWGDHQPTLATFDADQAGKFSKTVTFSLPMLIEGTNIVINQGVTVIVTAAGTRYMLPMTAGDNQVLPAG